MNITISTDFNYDIDQINDGSSKTILIEVSIPTNNNFNTEQTKQW